MIKKCIPLLLFFLLLAPNAFAPDPFGPPLTIEELDGDPSIPLPWKLKVPNGSLTDNGAGIGTLNFWTGIASDLIPADDEVYDIGSLAANWASIHLGMDASFFGIYWKDGGNAGGWGSQFFPGTGGGAGMEYHAGADMSMSLVLYADSGIGQDQSVTPTFILAADFANTACTIKSSGTAPIWLLPNADIDDYISFTTTADQTTMNFVGQNGRITADSGTIDFDDEILTTEGNVGIGIAPTTNLHVAHATLNENAEFYHETYSTSGADYSRIRLRHSLSNTLGTLTETDNTSILGSIYFSGVNSSSAWSGGARIYAVQNGASGATYIPGYMALGGSSAATGTWSTLYLSDDDKVGIRVADPTVALDVLGDMLLTGNSVITGTLDVGGTGDGQIYATEGTHTVELANGTYALHAHVPSAGNGAYYLDETNNNYVLLLDGSNSMGLFCDTVNGTSVTLASPTHGLDVVGAIETDSTITGSGFTDGTFSVSSGNFTGVGNFSGSDVDMDLGTGTFVTTGIVTADDQLNIGSGAGSEKGDNNLIRTGSGSAFLNIKGGTGRAAVSLSNDRMTFYGGNAGTNPGIHFRTNCSSSTNQGSLVMYMDENSLTAWGGGVTPTTLVDFAWGGVAYNNVKIGGTSATAGESLYIRRNSAAASTDSWVVNLIQDATTDDQGTLRVQGDSATAPILGLYNASTLRFSVSTLGVVDIITTTDPQLRLTHTDGVDETDFYTNSDGELEIMPTARTIHLGDGTAGDSTFSFLGNTTQYTLIHDDSEGTLDLSAADITNKTQVEADGTIEFLGAATVWNDMQFQISSAKTNPANTAPTWETFTATTSEYAFSVNDEVDTYANEIPHWWKQGTAGDAHIHITTKAVPAQEQKARFTVTFAYVDTDEVWVEAPLTAELTIPINTLALTNFYLDLGDITLTNYLMEAQMRCRVSRVAKSAGGTEYVGDIFITQVGIHFEEDMVGSRTETEK